MKMVNAACPCPRVQDQDQTEYSVYPETCPGNQMLVMLMAYLSNLKKSAFHFHQSNEQCLKTSNWLECGLAASCLHLFKSLSLVLMASQLLCDL